MKIPVFVKILNALESVINPATSENQATIIANQRRSLLKKTVDLTASGTIHTPTSGKKIRLYNMRFSLSADMTSVAYNFGANPDFEKYTNPKGGGLYGTNIHPDYNDGAINEALEVVIVGTGTVTTNIVYEEI
jgi:hypothetical protein